MTRWLAKAGLYVAATFITFACSLIAAVIAHVLGASDTASGVVIGAVVVGMWPALSWLSDRADLS